MQSGLASGIRLELRAFVAAAGTKRSLPTTFHVGHPGEEHRSWRHDVTADASLRADLVERAIDGLTTTDGACAWVTRTGDLAVADADAEWFAATRTGFARHGLVLPAFFVLNRVGWLDLVSGEERRWSRIRNRSPRRSR